MPVLKNAETLLAKEMTGVMAAMISGQYILIGEEDSDDEAGDDEAGDDEAGDDEAGDDEAGGDEAGNPIVIDR